MPLTRIYISGPLAERLELSLPPAQAHHVTRVLRMKEGERLTVFNGEGAEFAAVITGVARNAVRVRVERACVVSREAPVPVTLAQGVSRGERMDYTVQKAVELGIARIEPVLTRRGMVRLDAARARQKVAHWQTIAIGACEQCGRNRVPEIAPLMDLEDWLARRHGAGATAPALLLDPGATVRLRDVPAPAGSVTLLAGPEGGLTGEERAGALETGFTAIRLGPRVLRTETAALAALAAMQALWGDF